MTELDHSLQCAAALKLSAPDDESLQVAGLLHDVGHGLSHIRSHDRAGEVALAGVVAPRIARLVGLHVAAKRYLVTTDPNYRARLSPVSIISLAQQGGDMSAAEIAAFEAEPEAEGAVKLRRADEAAKVVGRRVEGLAAWLPMLKTHAQSPS